MKNQNLTDTLIRNLKPRRRQYDIRDAALVGFGVRVYPTGRKVFFRQCQNRGRHKWELLGEAGDMTEGQARKLARARISAVREPGAPRRLEPMAFEDAGEMFFQRYARHWKPATLQTNRDYYRLHILPFFSGMAIGDIGRKHVERWFASLGDRPGLANRALPVLSVMMREAEVYGLRADNSNPCRGISRYRRAAKERFLSAAELSRLGAALRSYRKTSPLAAAFLELLALTGCRKGELAGLRWADYRHGNLYLPDSKTGPKTVYLSAPARAVLDAVPKTDGRVFPSARRKGAAFSIAPHWRAVREAAGLNGVRLHDLRHTYASTALAHGEHILAIGRLLGHADPETTLKYAHLADEQVRATTRAVSTAIAGAM